MARRLELALPLAAVMAIAGGGVASAATSWRELHRPLDLPAVKAGQPCPVSPVDQRIDWESTGIFGGSGIGRGPAYPALGSDSGNFVARHSDPDGSWFGKLFWYVKPSYPGRVLIRGQRLDSAGSLQFGGGFTRGVSSELRIGPDDTVTWRGQPEGSRGTPSYLIIQSAGCYGVQVDAARSSRTVVFTATTG